MANNLIKIIFVGNASPQEQTGEIMLAPGPNGEPRTLKLGGAESDALVTNDELHMLTARFQIEVPEDQPELTTEQEDQQTPNVTVVGNSEVTLPNPNPDAVMTSSEEDAHKQQEEQQDQEEAQREAEAVAKTQEEQKSQPDPAPSPTSAPDLAPAPVPSAPEAAPEAPTPSPTPAPAPVQPSQLPTSPQPAQPVSGEGSGESMPQPAEPVSPTSTPGQ
jgi:peptidoglycan DL-endopeptidase CwlO